MAAELANNPHLKGFHSLEQISQVDPARPALKVTKTVMFVQCCICYAVRDPNGYFRDHGLKQCVGSWQDEQVSHTYCPVCKEVALRDTAAIA